MNFDLDTASWVALGLAFVIGLLLIWAIFAIVDSQRDHIHCDVTWDHANHCIKLAITKKYCHYGRRYRFQIIVNKKVIKEEYIPSERRGKAYVEYRLPLAVGSSDIGAVHTTDTLDVWVDKYKLCNILKK